MYSSRTGQLTRDYRPDPQIYVRLMQESQRLGRGGEFSTCFTELQRAFLKQRPTKVKSLVRLVKRWYQEVWPSQPDGGERGVGRGGAGEGEGQGQGKGGRKDRRREGQVPVDPRDLPSWSVPAPGMVTPPFQVLWPKPWVFLDSFRPFTPSPSQDMTLARHVECI